ncbi:unnamed protein product [Blumeria hordei]|uniref:Uncharacterized protein n=1 Tax=Blumeria hordei TaxID=2867405 RepID=A0A383UYW5_BLUHO|nr:unnamed protein product [Blumeria hordei]
MVVPNSIGWRHIIPIFGREGLREGWTNSRNMAFASLEVGWYEINDSLVNFLCSFCRRHSCCIRFPIS